MTNKKISTLALIVALIALALVIIRPSAHDSLGTAKQETAFERVVRTGKLRCGYAISAPVLVKDANTGQLSGLDYDIWQQIGKQLGLEIVWAEEAGWGNFIEGLRTNRYDAFCSAIWADDVRSKFLSLSEPTRYSVEYIYVLADDHRFDGDLQKLNHPEVILPVIDGDVSEATTKVQFPKAQLLSLAQTATISDMLISMTTHKADALILDPAMASSLNRSNPAQIRRLENTPTVNTNANYYSFNAGETSLRDMVNVALSNLIDNGIMEKLAKTYSPDYGVVHKNYDAPR